MECMCLLTIGISTIGICWCILVIGNPNSEDTISKVKSRIFIQGFTYFLVKNTVQVQGGLTNLFSGQSALQHEFGYNLGRFASKFQSILPSRIVYFVVYYVFRFGNNSRIHNRNTNTSIQRCLESTNGCFRFGFEILPSHVCTWIMYVLEFSKTIKRCWSLSYIEKS